LKRYETIFIAHPELSGEDQTELEKKLRSTIANWKGDVIKLEDWGTKKLSYEIRKNSRGRYFLLDYLAAADLVRELERNLRLHDQVLKFQTVRVNDRVSSEAAKTLKQAAPAEKVAKISEGPLPPEGRRMEEQERAETEGGEGK
jgi:small subunit ribosomal protein S6